MNTNTGNISFELNCRYHLYVLFKKDTNFYFISTLIDTLTNKLKNLISFY